MRRYRLMIPGPVEVDPDVLTHMSDPLTAHYGERWIGILNETKANLRAIFRTSGDVFVVVGSGNTGTDMVINSLFDEGDHVLALDNGYFGHRLGEVAESHGLRVTWLTKRWGSPFRPADIDAAVAGAPDLKAVLVVHGETSTGVANPVHDLAQAARKHDLLVVVDGIASLGGEPFEMDAWGVDVCVTASQKALESPPGLALIAINSRAWQAIDRCQGHRGWVGNLQTWRRFASEQADYHPHPGTIPVNNVVALRSSTRLILDEGLEARWERHARIARVVRSGMRAMGLAVMADEDVACANLTVIESAGLFNPGALVEFLKAEYGIHIAQGIREWFDKAVRIGHMGPNASLGAIVPLLVGVEHFLRQSGHRVERGSCLAGLT
ncbi:MAG: alanine--glyoxylate aminotransferase family protein [Candidatus Latescibacteria bacterium]|nr:alanine--glyoxylate aminotransferase family protein [Candidatus Latescibacterota bacterium]